jgi:hypothetical protein
VTISYAAKIPLKSVALALRGSESEHAQDALRVLDIVLRQQQAKRYPISFVITVTNLLFFTYFLVTTCVCCFLYTEVVYLLGSHFLVMTVETLLI